MTAMIMSIDEIFIESIMSSTPTLIVEGIDDIKTYVSIVKGVLDRVEVIPIELIKGYSPGCGHIENAIKDLREISQDGPAVENYILGIMDGDVKSFRNELPQDSAILILKYYSIESHFVCEGVLKNALSLFLKVHFDSIGEDFCKELFKKIETRLEDLYYFSLEALKCATEMGYGADFRYSYNLARKNQPAVRTPIFGKRALLDEFANSHNLSICTETLKKIAKGKWLLEEFSEAIYFSFKDLSRYCGSFGSRKCGFCAAMAKEKCTFRLKDGINNRTIYSSAVENVDVDDLNYIRDRVAKIPGTHDILN